MRYADATGTGQFQRARSTAAKQVRQTAILAAARELAERGVRVITLTDIAAAVGMHKSAMLRYFETREEIFLRLAAAQWQKWSQFVRDELGRSLDQVPDWSAEPAGTAAHIFATSLVNRPLFCDLLAHTPLSLERNVSLETVRSFKLTALAESGAVASALHRRLPLLTPEHALS